MWEPVMSTGSVDQHTVMREPVMSTGSVHQHTIMREPVLSTGSVHQHTCGNLQGVFTKTLIAGSHRESTVLHKKYQ